MFLKNVNLTQKFPRAPGGLRSPLGKLKSPAGRWFSILNFSTGKCAGTRETWFGLDRRSGEESKMAALLIILIGVLGLIKQTGSQGNLFMSFLIIPYNWENVPWTTTPPFFLQWILNHYWTSTFKKKFNLFFLFVPFDLSWTLIVVLR